MLSFFRGAAALGLMFCGVAAFDPGAAGQILRAAGEAAIRQSGPELDVAPVGIIVTMPSGDVYVPSTADDCATAWDHFDGDAFPAGRAVCMPLDAE